VEDLSFDMARWSGAGRAWWLAPLHKIRGVVRRGAGGGQLVPRTELEASMPV